MIFSTKCHENRRNGELSGKVLKHGTRRRVRHRRQFHCKFETLDFEKDKFTVKFAREREQWNFLEILKVGMENRRTSMHINKAGTIPIKGQGFQSGLV